MERKVQAQRKFAVGANIPNPNRQLLNIERQTENLSNDPKITQIHSSPKSALDIVSFQAMHSHKQPFVLIERLNEHKIPLQGTGMSSNPREFGHCEKSDFSLTRQDTVEESPHSSNDSLPLMEPLTVQAQRKFAVGSDIPSPIRQEPIIERQSENLSNDPKITQIHLSPKSTLDIVSFQAMHTHKQPFVLLERLNDNMPLQDSGMTSTPRESESPHSSNDTPPPMDPLTASSCMDPVSECLDENSHRVHLILLQDLLGRRKKEYQDVLFPPELI